MIGLWLGSHSEALRARIRSIWDGERHGELLIVGFPSLDDFRFLEALPEGPVEFYGEWTERQRAAAFFAIERRSGVSIPFAEEPIFGVFTTGTTSGEPRLILYSRRNIESSILAIHSVLSARDSGRIDAVFCYPQPFHCFGLILGYLMSSVLGYRLVAPDGRYGSHFHREWLETGGPGTLTLGTPAHFHDLIEFVRREKVVPCGSYSSIAGGAAVTRRLWLEMRDTLRIQAPSIGYGASEASPGVMHHPPGVVPLEDGEIGYPLPGVEIELIEGKGIEFSGPNRCLAIVSGGRLELPVRILLTDDVRRRPDGMYTFHGRTQLIMNRGGVKLSLERMEEVIRSELGLDILCVALSDDRLGEELGVMLRTARSLESRGDVKAEIFSTLRERFFQKFDSTRFLEVPEFPVNSSVKVDRRAAARLFSLERGAP